MATDLIDPAELQSYEDWLNENLDAVCKEYPGKFIAVYGGRLIAVGDSYKEVFAAAKAQGINDAPFTMEIPKPEDIQHMWPSVF